MSQFSQRALKSLLPIGVAISIGFVLWLLLAYPTHAGSRALARAYSPTSGPCFAYWNGASFTSTDASAIQQALDAAVNGDLVKIAGYCAGVESSANVYTQTIYLSKTITLQGGYTTTNWSDSYPITQPTTLDAQNAGRIAYLTDGVSVTISDLQLTNGNATTAYYSGHGGAIYSAGADLTLSNCVIFSNTGNSTGMGFGGAVYIDYGRSTLIINNLIISNTASADPISASSGSGGGVSTSGSGEPLVMISNTFMNNLASLSGRGDGGAVSSYVYAAQFISNTFMRNTASYSGTGVGGALEIGGGSSAVVTGNLFLSNTASYSGTTGLGGALATFSSGGLIQGNVFTGNIGAGAAFARGAGGGVWVGAISSFTLTNNLFDGNVASTGSIAWGQGGGLYVSQINCTISSNIFDGNTAATGSSSHGDGGGLNGYQAGGIISGNLMVNNVGAYTGGGSGGAMYFEDSGPLIFNNRLLGNTASYQSGSGGAIALVGGGAPSVISNTIVGNFASSDGSGHGGGLDAADSVSLTLTGNLIGRNHADGLYLESGDFTLINNVIADNGLNGLQFKGTLRSSTGNLIHNTIANHAGGSGINAANRVTLSLTNTLLSGNGTYGLYADNTTSVTLAATDWFSNGTDLLASGSVISSGNVYGDPAFIDPANDDYHLTATSAAIDAGIQAGITNDLDGQPRDNRPDLGAYEFSSVAVSGLTAINNSPTPLGSSTTFTAAVAAGTQPAYLWSFGDGQIENGALSAHTYTSTGIFSATVNAMNGVSGPITATTTVTITDAPIEGLNAMNDGPTLVHFPTLFTATIASGTHVLYEWSFGDGFTSTRSSLSTAAHTYATYGYFTAMVTATNSLSTTAAVTNVLIKPYRIYLPLMLKNH
jgi:hypothetical protein